MARLITALAVALTLLAGPAGSVPAAAAQPDVTAAAAVLWDPADDRVLWGKAETRALPPASTTKIMTVLLALEAGSVGEEVTVSAEAARTGRSPGAATFNLTAGQRVSMRSLLAGLVLRSGNDGAVAVAEHVAGSEDAFVEKMNARAAELGLDDTRFVNATGLTDDRAHHASALDLARLAEVALRHDEFARWAAAGAMTVAPLGRLENRNELLERYPGANGVKTGYTDLAGLCLVASAQRRGRALVAVVLGSTGGLGADTSFVDSARILDHGFEDFRRPTPVRADQPVMAYRWGDTRVRLLAEETLAQTVATGREVSWRVVLDPAAPRPVAAGTVLGRAELVVDGAVAKTTRLRTAREVSEPASRSAPARAGGAVQEVLRAFARTYVVDRAA